MSVEQFVLPITDDELQALLAAPESVHQLVDSRDADVLCLDNILFEEGDEDLAFLVEGVPEPDGQWLGEYEEEDGRVLKCQIDMGYGPPWYCKNTFLVKVAKDMELAAEDHPDAELAALNELKLCVKQTADAGNHLLIWCA